MKSLIANSVKYKIGSNILIILVFITGIVGYINTKRSSFPIKDSTTISVSVVYPGASPEEIEEGIVLKIEEAVQGIEGIKEVTSISKENSGSVNVEIYSNYDIDELVTEVKNSVDRINSFPLGAEKPTVFKVKQADLAGVLILQGNIPQLELKQYADRIEDELLQLDEISQVQITGVPDLEISVEVSELVLRQNRLTFDDLSNAIRRNNTDISAGVIKSNDEEVLIRSNAKKYEPEQLENIVLRSKADGSILKLGDIATIEERFADDPNKTIFNGGSAITINVNKLEEEDLIKIVDQLYQYIDDFNAKEQEVSIVFSFDNSKNLKDRIALLLENGGVGLLLVLIVLGLFLSLRLSGWVAFGIIFSFLAFFGVYYMLGGTINLISLFGMILIIGILVDDGIVIAENVYAHFEMGKSPKQAAIDGSVEILPSVFVSVFTTILVFTIFFSVEGQPGVIMQTIAGVVILTLAFSLIEAVIILPAHLSSKSILNHNPPKTRWQRLGKRFRDTLDGFIAFLRDKLYGRTLKVALNNKYITATLPIFFIILVVAALVGRKIAFTFFPIIPFDFVTVNLTMPAGTPAHVTEAKLNYIAEKTWEINRDFKEEYGVDSLINSVRVTIGGGNPVLGGPNLGGGTLTGTNAGAILIELVTAEKRGAVTDSDVSNAIRDRVGQIPEAEEFTVGGNPFFGKDVSLSLRSTDLEQLQGFKTQLKEALYSFSTLRDVIDNDVSGNREVQIELKDKAYNLGLTHQEISRQIRQGFFGEEVQRLQKGKNEVKIWVRYNKEDRKSIGKLEEIRIKTPTGQEYPLGDLVTYSIDRSLVVINHLNGGREIRVEAVAKDASVNVPDVLTNIRDSILPPLLAQYPLVSISEEGQAKESQEAFSGMGKSAPIVLVSVILLIAWTFRSFSQAFLIVPMMIVGVFCAILGHGIENIIQTDRTVAVSILSIFGILALMGVIVNDAVIFLNKFNLLIKEGYNIKKAVYEAGIARFRPILLTSLTTIVGLYPIILEKSFQAEFLKPMAISMAYGVAFGTAFILLTFPAYILIVNDMRRYVGFLWRGYWKSSEDVEPAKREEIKLKELKV